MYYLQYFFAVQNLNFVLDVERDSTLTQFPAPLWIRQSSFNPFCKVAQHERQPALDIEHRRLSLLLLICNIVHYLYSSTPIKSDVPLGKEMPPTSQRKTPFEASSRVR